MLEIVPVSWSIENLRYILTGENQNHAKSQQDLYL
jgi:hypothetical protein